MKERSLQLPSLLVRSLESCQALTRQAAKELIAMESKTDVGIDYVLIEAEIYSLKSYVIRKF